MKISVAMCTYNGEKYLAEQLDSILRQTVLPDEIVVFDDNSADSTYEILKKYESNHGEVKWKIKQNLVNVGYKKNFFELLKSCDSDYVFLCDQDDIWMDCKIEHMISVMKHKRANLVMSNLEPLYMPNSKKVYFKLFFSFSKIKKISLYSTLPDTPRPGCTYCVNKSLLQKDFSAFQCEYAHDLVLFYFAAKDNSAYLLKEKLIRFRRHSSNVSSRTPITIESRVKYLENKILFLNTVKKINTDKKVDKLLFFFQKRKYYIVNQKKAGLFYLATHLSQYSKMRFFLSDIYYLLFCKKH